MALTQENRVMAIETPLGKDEVVLQSLRGREGISELYAFDVELLSEDPSIAFDKVVGQPAAIAIRLPDGEERHLHGYVSRFGQGSQDRRFTHYRAEIVPWLWFLTRTSNCRIFQEKTAPEIIKQVFTDLGFKDFSDKLQGSFEKREYCVQYRETDFQFVSRLMEEEGIFYFFTHGKEKHTLVLGNGSGAHPACEGQNEARCAAATGGLENEDVVTACDVEQELRPGKLAVADFNFETPSTRLLSNVGSKVSVGGNKAYELYDYPGGYQKKAGGDQVAKLRMEEEEATHSVLSGESTCRAFSSGVKFKLTEHYRADLNQEYTLLSVEHDATAGEAYVSGADGEGKEYYENRFACIPHKTPYRSPRETPRPVVEGPQTAVVVGKSGEEIWTDEHGRVKVQFHWDREGDADANSSCWIRVSQGWAGKKWGMTFLPRIGQEVIVDFLEGDPDRPIITGRVYNAEQKPPYDLPGEQTKSGVQSLSSKGGGGTNEIRFEDKKGGEQVFLHAQKDQEARVKEKSLEWVGKSRHLIVGADQLEKVSGDKHLTITGDHNEKVDGTVSVEAGMDMQEKVAMKYALDAGMEIHHKAGMSVVIESATNLTLKVGGNFININPGGVFIQGTMLMINSGGSAGSGAGSSPEEPKLPEAAEEGSPGDMGAPGPASAARSGQVSPQAVALRQAAQQGAPFCEACEAAKRELLRRQEETARPEEPPAAEETPEDEYERPLDVAMGAKAEGPPVLEAEVEIEAPPVLEAVVEIEEPPVLEAVVEIEEPPVLEVDVEVEESVAEPLASPAGAGAQPGLSADEGQLYWVEFSLLDEDGKPLANESFRIELPDGRVQTGKLDGNGRARVENVQQSGDCTLHFPDLAGEIRQNH